MNTIDFYSIINSAQISTSLMLIAIALVYIAFKLSEKKRSSK